MSIPYLLQQHELAAREEYKSPDAVWNDYLNWQELQRTAEKPEATSNIFNGTPQAEPGIWERGGPYADEASSWSADTQRDAAVYTDQFETTFNGLRGMGDPMWMIEQDPEDLGLLFTGTPELDIAVYDELMHWSDQVNYVEERVAEQQADFEMRLDARVRSHRLIDLLVGKTSGGLLEFDTSREAAREKLLQEAEEEYEAGLGDRVMSIITSGFGWIGRGITWVEDSYYEHGGLNLALASVGTLPTRDIKMTGIIKADTSAERAEAQRQADLLYANSRFDTEMETRQAGIDFQREAIFQAAQDGSIQQLLPDLWGTMYEATGGDQVKTLGLVMGAIEDSQSVEEQLQLGEMVRNETIRTIEENDYRVNAQILDLMAAWDRLVPSRLATGSLLFLTDDDMKFAMANREWRNALNRIDEFDRTPSNVLGWENSFGGFMLDMGGSMIFDPTTYMFAPAGKAAFGKPMSKAAARDMARSGVGKQAVRDLMRKWGDGDAAVAHAALWIQEGSLEVYDELMALVSRTADDIGDVVMPGVDEATTATLRSMADDGVRWTLEEGAEVQGDIMRTLYDMKNQGVSPLHPKGEPMGRISIDVEGSKYSAFQYNLGGKRAVMFVNDEGVIGGGWYWTDAGGGMASIAPKGTGMMDEILDAMKGSNELSNSTIAEMITKTAADPTVSKAGAGALQKAAKNFLDGAEGKGAALVDLVPEQRITELVEKAILNGAVPGSHRRLALASSVGTKLKQAVRADKPASFLARYMGKHRTRTVFATSGRRAYTEAMENVHFLWADDAAKANEWTKRIMDGRKAAADAGQELLNDVRVGRLTELEKHLDTLGKYLEDELLEPSVRLEYQELRNTTLKEYDELAAALGDEFGGALDSGLYDVMLEMFDDYNRSVIAKLPDWQSKVVDGMVPWEELKLGGVRPQDPLYVGFGGLLPESAVDDMVDVVKAQNALNAVYQRGAHLTVTLPVSPYDAILAGYAGGAKYLKYRKSKVLGGVQNFASDVHRAWKLDKILRLSTAAVVSADELFRVFHLYGVEAVQQYISDKLLKIYESGRNVMSRKGSGFEKLTPKMQARIRELSNIPGYITEAEALLWDQLGQTTKVINPGDVGYKGAAREFYRNFTAQPAFRAYLQGEDAFRAWWQTDAAATTRRSFANTSNGPRALQVDDAYRGWDTIYQVLTREVPQQKLKFVRDELMKAADEIAAGNRGYMPDAVFDYTPAVKGQTRAAFDNKINNVVGTASEFMLDKFFMDPTNYRRGFLYNMAKGKEVQRLRRLFADQNRKILSDSELIEAMGLPPGASLASFPKDVLDVFASRRGLVTERMIDDMAESAAIGELENVFYAWDQGSRFGNSMRAVFPFGGPWADMWGFWGREVLSKPILRGDINNNAFLRTLQQGINDVPLPNLKTGAFISRISNRDFNITEGLLGEGEGPDVDLSPLLFFPTQGENSFQTMIPGLGVLPSMLIDWSLEKAVDPIEDPEGYQRLLDEVSAVLPGVQYTTGDIASDWLGGGNIAALWKTAVGTTQAATTALGQPSPWRSFAGLGDYSADIELNRELGAHLAEDIEELLSIQDPELFAAAIQGLLIEAKGATGGRTAASGAARFVLPARFDWDDSAEQLQDVWVQAATQFPQLAPRDITQEQLGDPEFLRQYVNEVRDTYFDLPQDQADLLLVQYPALAVNLVSNWQWTDSAKDNLDERELLFPYRSGGSNEDAARHQTYVERGIIEPMSALSRAYVIMGTVLRARERTATAIYSETADAVNDLLWEGYVSDRDKAIIEAHLTEFGDKYQVKDAETLWKRWGSWEDDFEEELARAMDMDPESEEFKDLARKINVKTRAWGTTRPSRGESLSNRFTNLIVGDIPLDMLPIDKMEALGIDFDAAMTGEQLWQGTVDAVWNNPSFNVEVKGPYMTYMSTRGERRQTAVSQLGQMFERDGYSPEFRQQVSEFLIVEENITDRIDELGYLRLRDQREVRNRFRNLMVTSGDETALRRLWEDGFEPRFGPLEWTPPTPPPLFEEGGELNRYAYRPTIREITDGDTLVVSLGTPVLGSVSVQNKKVRLLGVRARDFGIDDEGALEDKQALMDALLEAVRADATIYLVRDPDQFGSNTDKYGRELAWLYIGDEPWYSEDAFLPTDR